MVSFKQNVKYLHSFWSFSLNYKTCLKKCCPTLLCHNRNTSRFTTWVEPGFSHTPEFLTRKWHCIPVPHGCMVSDYLSSFLSKCVLKSEKSVCYINNRHNRTHIICKEVHFWGLKAKYYVLLCVQLFKHLLLAIYMLACLSYARN